MMDKTIKINLGGTLFQIDEDAYRILRQYLQDIDARLKHTPEGAEILEDIESRIAEIFQSQGGTAGVINKENVEAMIAIIGKPETFEVNDEEKYFESPSYQSSIPKKLYRNPDDSIISGVCGGIGLYLNIESVWIRILFVMFACFFGIGIFVYLALWVALPSAKTDIEKKEMHGSSNYSTVSRNKRRGNATSANDPAYNKSFSSGSDIGNAFNEIFRAIGKVAFVIVRIFLIIIGLCFVLAGFAVLVSTIMVFFFNYPGSFSTHSFGFNMFYIPDFLNYIVSPAIVPWIVAFSFIAILIPLLFLIYLGIKMIFWFKAKDGIVSLIGFIIWVISIVALSIILFNEGVSFAETGKTVSEEVLAKVPANLYIISDHKVSDLQYNKEFSLSEEDYNIYLLGKNKTIFIGTNLHINNSDDSSLKINVRKRSSGRNRADAMKKAEGLSYNYRISGDTIFVDEYFAISQGNKWSFDNVGININIPKGTIVHFDNTTENMYHHYRHGGRSWDEEERNWDNDSDNSYSNQSDEGLVWIMTENGLRISADKKK